MTELKDVYRVMILYMLSRVSGSLSNTQITNCILDLGYTTYFRVQHALSDLVSLELITAQPTHSNTHYRMTKAGEETLRLLGDRIHEGMRVDIAEWMQAHECEIREETSFFADFYKAPQKGYFVHCQIRGSEVTIMDLTIHADSVEQAKAICSNWAREGTEIYGLMMDRLVK